MARQQDYFGQESFPVVTKVMDWGQPPSESMAGAALSKVVFPPIRIQLLLHEYEYLSTCFGYLHTHAWHHP